MKGQGQSEKEILLQPYASQGHAEPLYKQRSKLK